MKKKLLLSLGTTIATLSPIVAVISCGSENKTKDEEAKEQANPGQGSGAHNGEESRTPSYTPSHFSSPDWDSHDVEAYNNGHGWVRPLAKFMSDGIPVPQTYVYIFEAADDYETADVLGRALVKPYADGTHDVSQDPYNETQGWNNVQTPNGPGGRYTLSNWCRTCGYSKSIY